VAAVDAGVVVEGAGLGASGVVVKQRAADLVVLRITAVGSVAIGGSAVRVSISSWALVCHDVQLSRGLAVGRRRWEASSRGSGGEGSWGEERVWVRVMRAMERQQW